jgi:hypothetical protein
MGLCHPLLHVRDFCFVFLPVSVFLIYSDFHGFRNVIFPFFCFSIPRRCQDTSCMLLAACAMPKLQQTRMQVYGSILRRWRWAIARKSCVPACGALLCNIIGCVHLLWSEQYGFFIFRAKCLQFPQSGSAPTSSVSSAYYGQFILFFHIFVILFFFSEYLGCDFLFSNKRENKQ